MLFSNFGIVNSTFDNEGTTVDMMMGEGKQVRECKIKTYEFFQISF